MALWVAFPLLELLHADAHGHRFCLEHQAFEEMAGEPSGVRAAAVPMDAGSGMSLEARREVEAQAPHERCPLAWAEQRRLKLPRMLAALPVSEPPVVSRLDEGQRWAPAVPVLALAPKASPPVR